MITNLIKLADTLDIRGFYDEAEALDLIIKKVAVAQHTGAVRDFVGALKREFEAFAKMKDQFLSINEKSLPEILGVIDETLASGDFVEGYTSLETLQQLEPGSPHRIAQGIMALEDNIRQIEQIQTQLDASFNEEEERALYNEKEKYIDELHNL